MKISEINIIPIKPKDGLLGFTSFVIDDQFFIGHVGIHSTPNGDIRLLYPNRCLPNGKFISCFHPITKEAGLEITKNISHQYHVIFNKFSHEIYP